MNAGRLAVVRGEAPGVAGRESFANVTSNKRKTQDLALDLVLLDQSPAKHPREIKGDDYYGNYRRAANRTWGRAGRQRKMLLRQTSDGGSSAAETIAAADSADFARTLAKHGLAPLTRARVTTLQVNVGKLCNMTCHHCHVDAGPKRAEVMPAKAAERVIEVIAQNSQVKAVDVTGGAPELNPNFRWLVSEARRLGREVIDRCNLTILLQPGMEDLADFLAEHRVHIIASLPCYSTDNVDKQRGRGAFDKSIEALRRLNAHSYGLPNSELKLDLVYNPVGAFLPPPQGRLEAEYKDVLGRSFGVQFHRLLTITNMPISRFAALLERTGQHEAYMSLLVNHFNSRTVSDLMCRTLVSVGWDGRLYDCDFNQMLEIGLGATSDTGIRTIWDVTSLDEFNDRRITTGSHCFGCTAGAGSSCSGAIH